MVNYKNKLMNLLDHQEGVQMTFKPSVKTQIERCQNEMDDAMEALSVLDSAIACGFLKDKHSLIAQEWCKEYQKDIDNCRMFLDNIPKGV